MSQKLKLSISQPCHENWQNMTPTEKGKFCNVCTKEVVDFTSMSDTEVLNHFIKRKSENTCGRFYNDQLNREIVKPVYTAKNISWYWNYLVMLFMLLFKTETGKSQTIIKPIKIEQLSNVDRSCSITLGGVMAGVSVVDVTFSGQVTDERGNSVAGAIVKVKGTNITTVTDLQGKYKLEDISNGDVLQISSVGFCTREVKASSSGNQVTVLKETVSGEVVVVGAFSADYDYTPAAAPTHVAVIEVRDDQNSMPVKATITIENQNEEDEEQTTVTTNKNGTYKLRQIGSRDCYRVSITAEGYKDEVLNIEGWKFNDRKETRHVFLKRKETALVENRRIILGGAQTSFKEPIYIVDGLLSSAEKVKQIKPEEIESINVLKDATSITLCTNPNRTVILITMKKHRSSTSSIKVTTDNKQQKIADKKLVSNSIDDFKISPNPVEKGSACTISFTSALTGEYGLQILNASGVLVQFQKIAVTQKQHRLQVQTSTNWISGVYHVTISGNNGKVIYVGSLLMK